MLDDLGQLVSNIWTFLSIAIWIIVIIDCVRNQKKHKFWWLALVSLGNWIGVVIYLLVARADLLKRIFWAIQKWVRHQSASTRYYPPSSPQPPSQPSMPYYEYRQGYQGYQQPYQTPSTSSTSVAQFSDFPAYEQPQATYPEMPPMEQ